MKLFDVKDKIVVITGGLGQLGRNYTSVLLGHHAKVAVFDINASEGDKKNTECYLEIKVDITSKNSIANGLQKVIDAWGVPDGLVNNAAMDSPPNAPVEENGPFETFPEESWDRIMDVNAKGVFLCCQLIGGKMAEAGKGSIINICSTYGILSPDQRIYEYRRENQTPFCKPVAYSASKSSLTNLTRYLSTYWAAKKVRVNTLTLGGVFNHQDEAFLKGYCHRVPMGRMAESDEFNGAVIFLISEASSYMTGANLVIDGGWSAW
jgi:NAD(P)-dependent dehydrogenase (short-subunit alcohol dehydrogenase family)